MLNRVCAVCIVLNYEVKMIIAVNELFTDVSYTLNKVCGLLSLISTKAWVEHASTTW